MFALEPDIEAAIGKLGNRAEAVDDLCRSIDIEPKPSFPIEEMGNISFNDDPALPQDRDVIADALDLIKEMAGKENRCSILFCQFSQESPHLQDAVWVEAVRGLVEDDGIGSGNQRACNPEPLLHSQRELSRLFVCRSKYPHTSKDSVDVQAPFRI